MRLATKLARRVQKIAFPIWIRGITKLFTAERKALVGVGSRGHFGCIIGPEAERVGAGVAA